MGLLATALVAGALYYGWLQYKDFLTQGMRPTESTLKLNEMEKSGVPRFEMQDISGQTIRLEDYKDKIVVLNFWASWCAPCIQEFPSMIRLLQKFPEQVVLLAISHDRTEEDLMSFLDAFEVHKVPNFKVIWDRNEKLADEFGTEVLPESYILSYGLKLERKVVGVEEWDQPLALKYFESLINDPR